MTTDFLRLYSETPFDGKYQILSVLGIGGMGEVYKALHVHLHALRVIKLMRASIAGDPEAHDRFLREARLATRIQHPNVAALFDFSALPDGSFYMVWEFIDGMNLRKFVRERQFLRPDAAVGLACQALMGLEAIHRVGIVHRDVSPENLMVTRDEHGRDRIKIIDLGVAKQWNEAGDNQTRSGMFVGKFKYCSPEQLGMLKVGERIDGRADLYSFGLVLYEMLTGVAPFEAETPHQYLVLHSAHMPRPLRQANPQAIVPPQLEALIFRALAKDRERRFDSAAEFAKALEDALPALPDTIAYPSTVVAALPTAESVAEVEIPAPRPTRIREQPPTPPSAPPRKPLPGIVDSTSGRKRDLLEQVVSAMGNEQYARADAALQTLRMHLGVRADTDTELRKIRKELETAAAEKEAWYVQAIDQARQQGKPKEVQRLLNERDELLGRRFGDPAVRFETEVWLRKRDELLAKTRNWIAAESFASAGLLLDELATHLEDGVAGDEEYLALRHGFQQALVDSSEKMRQEIVAVHAQQNIAKTRRLLSMYDARFGGERGKHPAVVAAEAWIREMDGMRKASQPKQETTMVRRARRRSRLGVLFVLLVLLALSGALFATRRWKSETADLIRRHTTGEMQTMFLDALGVPPAAVVDLSHPPSLDPAKQMREAQIWVNPIDHLEYVWIPSGIFEMGCVDGDHQCAPNEGPRHAVSINGFWLGRTELTAEAFERFARQRGYRSSPHVATAKLDPDLTIEEQTQPKWPAAWLSANDAAAYCAWAGGRLPTEEEWEYAARQGDAKTIHSWGNEAHPPMRVANLSDDALIHRFAIPKRVRRELFEGVSDGFETYAPVGSFPPNRLGLFDLEGNVWEWCVDRDGSPTLRGGSWGSRARDVRISARKKMPSDFAGWGTGCRCAISAEGRRNPA